MAFVASLGSSLATDRWMRRGGLSSSAQAFKVGNATLLHQHSSEKPTAHSGSAWAISISRSLASLAFFSFVERIGGSDPALRPHPPHRKQARERSPDRLPRDSTRLSVSPSSKATSAAISKVQRLDSCPNSLGERWSISLKAKAFSWSKAACTRLGREEPGVRAARPFSLKARMALRTVC